MLLTEFPIIHAFPLPRCIVCPDTVTVRALRHEFGTCYQLPLVFTHGEHRSKPRARQYKPHEYGSLRDVEPEAFGSRCGLDYGGVSPASGTLEQLTRFSACGTSVQDSIIFPRIMAVLILDCRSCMEPASDVVLERCVGLG